MSAVDSAPVVQWIEHQPSKLVIEVRFLSGVPKSKFSESLILVWLYNQARNYFKENF